MVERNVSPPRLLGRFNYVCFSADRLFNVLFTPYVGASCCLIARNLPEDEAKELIRVLNGELDITGRNIQVGFDEENNE